MISRKVDYHEYMASREWALKKKAVRERAENICERCASCEIQNIHHVTYRNLGHEDPWEDLQGLCRPCHEYLSAEKGIDPAEVVIRRLINDHGLKPFFYTMGPEAGQLAWFDAGETEFRLLAIHLQTTPRKTDKWHPVCLQLVPGVWAVSWWV